MFHFRPVFTLLAVISTVGVQFSTLSAQTKITIGYAASSIVSIKALIKLKLLRRFYGFIS